MLKVSNRNTRARYRICSKLTIKTREQRHCVLGYFIIKGTTLLRVLSKICVSGKVEDVVENSYKCKIESKGFNLTKK